MKQKVKKTTNLFLSGVVVLTLANVLVKVIGVGLKVPLANIIQNEGMSYYSVAYEVYVWFYMISTAGIPVAISMMISESRSKGHFLETKKIFRVAMVALIIIGFAGMSIMIFGSKLFAAAYSLDALYYSIIAIAPTLFFICIASALRGYFQGYQYMVPTAVSEVIESLGKLVIGIALALFAMKSINDSDPAKYGKAAAYTILGLTIGVAFGMVYLIIKKIRFNDIEYNRQFYRGRRTALASRPTKKLVHILILTAIPITISASIMSFTNMLDSMVISNRLQAIGYAVSTTSKDIEVIRHTVEYTLGYFKTQVVTLFNMPPALIYPISASVVPYLSSIIATGNRKHSKVVMNSSIRVVALISLPCALGMSVLSEPIIKLLFSSTFDETAPRLLSIQALAIFFLAMLSITTSILQSHRYERKPIISMIAGSVVKILASFILIGIRGIGIYGAPIGTFLCYFTIVLFNLYYVAKYVHFLPDFKHVFVRPLVASVVCAVTAFLVFKLFYLFLPSSVSVILAIGAAGLVYLVTVFKIRAIDVSDIKLIPKNEKLIPILVKIKLLKEQDVVKYEAKQRLLQKKEQI